MLRIIPLTVLAAALLSPPARAADADKYLPDDAQWVCRINVRQALAAPLVQQHVLPALRRLLAEQAGVAELLQAIAIDPFKDIDSIVLAGPMPPSTDKGLAIVRGRYDLAKIQAAVEDRAAKSAEAIKIHKHGSRSIYQFTHTGKTLGPLSACFLDDATLVLAPTRESVVDAIAKKDGDRPTVIDKDLHALIARSDDRQTVWLAALASKELKKTLSTSPETEKLFQNLQHGSGSLTVGTGLQLDCVIQTRDAGTAGELRKFLEAVKAILSLAALDSKRNDTLYAVLVKAVALRSVKDAVFIQGTLTQEQIEAGLKAKE
jgi:hypothetical protein